MSSRFRALALALTGGLLLLTSGATAAAATPFVPGPITQAGDRDVGPVILDFRDRKSAQLGDLGTGDSPGLAATPDTQTIDLSGRYDGKKVPI